MDFCEAFSPRTCQGGHRHLIIVVVVPEAFLGREVELLQDVFDERVEKVRVFVHAVIIVVVCFIVVVIIIEES